MAMPGMARRGNERGINLSEESLDEDLILQIFNKTKCVNLVSNGADAADQSSFGGKAVSMCVFELRHGLNHHFTISQLGQPRLDQPRLGQPRLAMEAV